MTHKLNFALDTIFNIYMFLLWHNFAPKNVLLGGKGEGVGGH